MINTWKIEANARPIRNNQKMFYYGEQLDNGTWKQYYSVTDSLEEVQQHFLNNPSKDARRIIGYYETVLNAKEVK